MFFAVIKNIYNERKLQSCVAVYGESSEFCLGKAAVLWVCWEFSTVSSR